MSDFALLDGGVCESDGAVAANGAGTLLTLSGGANAKGAYTQLVAATAREAVGILVQLQGRGSYEGAYDILVDIAIGAAASEVVLIPNLYLHATLTTEPGETSGASYFLPISVPAGSRIAARVAASSVTSLKVFANVVLLSGGLGSGAPLSRVTDLATVSASSSVTPVTGGNSAKGAYAQVIASTVNPTQALAVVAEIPAVASPADWGLVDIAVGAGGSEQIVIPDLFVPSAQAKVQPHAGVTLPISIPAGTRLSARAATVGASGGAALSVGLWGVD